MRRDLVHEQVVAHELPRFVHLFAQEAEPRQDPVAELRPRARVVLARSGRVRIPLADVVKERRQKERARTGDLRREARRERELVRQLTARELAQAIDRGHRVHVDRVHMIDVVMDAPDDGQKLRHHGQEQARVVEVTDDGPAGRPRLRNGAHELHEQVRRPGARAKTLAPRRVGRRAPDGVTREGQQRRTMPDASREGAHRDDRILLQVGGRADRDRSVEDVNAAAEVHRRRGLGATAGWPEALEEAGPRAGDRAGAKVKRLHQPLRREGAILPVSHRDGDGLLVVEAQAVRLARRAHVQPVSHAPEELLRLGDVVRFAPDQDADLDELAPDAVHRAARLFADAVARPRGPADPVQVPQRSGAVLDVRLEQVHRSAEALAPGGRLGFDAIDERTKVVLAEDSLVRLVDERPQQGRVAGEQSQVEQGRRGLEVLLGERHDLARA